MWTWLVRKFCKLSNSKLKCTSHGRPARVIINLFISILIYFTLSFCFFPLGFFSDPALRRRIFTDPSASNAVSLWFYGRSITIALTKNWSNKFTTTGLEIDIKYRCKSMWTNFNIKTNILIKLLNNLVSKQTINNNRLVQLSISNTKIKIDFKDEISIL